MRVHKPKTINTGHTNSAKMVSPSDTELETPNGSGNSETNSPYRENFSHPYCIMSKPEESLSNNRPKSRPRGFMLSNLFNIVFYLRTNFRISSSIGLTREGKNPTTSPSLLITYLQKFQEGDLPDFASSHL